MLSCWQRAWCCGLPVLAIQALLEPIPGTWRFQPWPSASGSLVQLTDLLPGAAQGLLVPDHCGLHLLALGGSREAPAAQDGTSHPLRTTRMIAQVVQCSACAARRGSPTLTPKLRSVSPFLTIPKDQNPQTKEAFSNIHLASFPVPCLGGRCPGRHTLLQPRPGCGWPCHRTEP